MTHSVWVGVSGPNDKNTSCWSWSELQVHTNVWWWYSSFCLQSTGHIFIQITTYIIYTLPSLDAVWKKSTGISVIIAQSLYLTEKCFPFLQFWEQARVCKLSTCANALPAQRHIFILFVTNNTSWYMFSYFFSMMRVCVCQCCYITTG